MIQNDHRCIQFIFGGWSVPRCGQYFGGDPGALNTQLFSPRCLSCFETRGIVFWRYKMSIGVYNLFLGAGLFLYVVNILGPLLTQLFSARWVSRFGTRDIFLVIKNKSYIILVIKMIYCE